MSSAWRKSGAALAVASLTAAFMSARGASGAPNGVPVKRACPSEMALVGRTCVDRYEIHTVDHKTGARLSPYYPPDPKLLAFVHDYWSLEAARVGSERARLFSLPEVPAVQQGDFSPRAVSAPGAVPQGYLSYFTAKRACENAGKRLCKEEEWLSACRSKQGTKYPYGKNLEAGRCNVFRQMHPAYELHGNSSLGHLDPRLNLVREEGRTPLLELTAARAGCAAQTRDDGAIFDMVGNLDEWIDDPNGVFVGGFYARGTREGCEAKIENHAAAYVDYSLGTRCCKDAPR